MSTANNLNFNHKNKGLFTEISQNDHLSKAWKDIMVMNILKVKEITMIIQINLK